MLRQAPGGEPVLVEPVPEFAYVSLPVLAMARIQEWLLWDDDLAAFTMCGYRFRVLSWADTEKALLLSCTRLPAA